MSLLWPSNNKYTEFWRKIERMSPKEKAMMPIKMARTLLNLIGVRFLSDLRVFWYAYMPGMMVLTYILLAMYTVIYYTYHNQFATGLKGTCVIGVAVPEVILYFEGINSNRYRFRKILFFATDSIYKDMTIETKLDRLCDHYGIKSIKMVILYMAFILLSTGQALVGPMIRFFQTGKFVTFLALKLPFIDEDLVWGLHLNIAVQMTITVFGTVGGLTIEMASCIVNNTIMLCSDIISFECNELSENIRKSKTSSNQNFAHLRNIMVQIQDFDRYVVEMSEIFYWRLFSAPVLIVYSVSISIFCQYVLDFPCGYGFAILAYSQLMIICYMGEIVLEANERITAALNRMPWYLLPFEKQKDIAHLMHRTQNGAVLTIGPFSALNYEAATDLTSLIYRIVMICMKFAD